MKIYAFYDTDDSGSEERDIRGDAYKKLIHICCWNSSVLCLKFLYSDIKTADRLNAFEIPKPENISGMPMNLSSYYCVRYYRVCSGLCNAMIDIAGGVFEWLYGWGFKNPDDPIFYRSDGSVFFVSEIHEGICAIMPREDEQLEDLLQVVPWLSEDDIWPKDRAWLREMAKGQGDGLREP